MWSTKRYLLTFSSSELSMELHHEQTGDVGDAIDLSLSNGERSPAKSAYVKQNDNRARDLLVTVKYNTTRSAQSDEFTV